MTTANIDIARPVEEVMGQVFQEATASSGLVLGYVGAELGLWECLRAAGPATAAEVASAAGCLERYVREWLLAQAAAGYVVYDAPSERFTLTATVAAVLADEQSPTYLGGVFSLAVGTARDATRLVQAFRNGDGIPAWEQDPARLEGLESLTRGQFEANLVTWITALDGVAETLDRGGTIADVCCGPGVSTVVMAHAFPRSICLASTTTRGPSPRPEAGQPPPGSPTDPGLRSPRPAHIRARATTWSASSTPCTTSAIRSPPSATFAAPSPRPAPSCSSSPPRTTGPRTTWRARPAGSTHRLDGLLPAGLPRPTRPRRDRSPGRPDRPGGPRRAGRVHPLPAHRRDAPADRVRGPAVSAPLPGVRTFGATIPSTDLERSRRFYEDVLGAVPLRDLGAEVVYRLGSGEFDVYASAHGGTARHTLGTVVVEDVVRAVAVLRACGVPVEEYDEPNLHTVDGVARLGPDLVAWFRDPTEISSP